MNDFTPTDLDLLIMKSFYIKNLLLKIPESKLRKTMTGANPEFLEKLKILLHQKWEQE